mmetsp:Transcript_24986/g.82363  ORF Transcript_24986/g.82363 Transcript_24986/m.82363 type:complete len:491 (+) Transcript_24986:144-1616(+)
MSTKLIDVVEVAEGESLVAHQKGGYEAEKALENIFRITCQPLTVGKINGKVITSTSLLGKDANHEGATFTAKMQPKITAGDDMELFFSCSNLVQLWHIKAYRQPKMLVNPNPFLIVKEKLDSGKWQEIGRTESAANTCHPTFSRSVLVRYKGFGVQQQLMVQALSYAKNIKNGIHLGECVFLLDDLVNSRTARVMKLPFLSADQAKNTGFLTINGSHHDVVEDGVWVTLNIRAENLLRPRRSLARKKDDLPNTFFEIWRHSIEGEKQVYKSETVACKSNPIWWPMALNGKKIRGSYSPDGVVWLRFFDQKEMSDLQHFFPAQPLGEAKIHLSRLKKGLRIPILDNWPENATNPYGIENHVPEDGPVLIIEDCKWLRLNKGAVLENELRYKTDLDYLQGLLENHQLDAAMREQIGNCILFVKSRSMYWAIQDALAENNQADQDLLERTVGSGTSFDAVTVASHASGQTFAMDFESAESKIDAISPVSARQK